MNYPLCEDFFLQPTQPLHRRYEALRAVFVEHRPLREVAQQYGYQYGTLRNLVSQFRGQCQHGQVPPFLSRRYVAAPRPLPRYAPNCRPSLIGVPCPSPPAGNCVVARRASSCSCPC